MTIKAGVIGYPIGHSLSPVIHGYWLKKYEIDGSYEAIEVAPENLDSFLRGLPTEGFKGCNITLPHKEAALSSIDEVDPFAEFIGAVNTVLVEDGKLQGTNTDFMGFARNIMESAPEHDMRDGKAVILGAGGAARAVAFALCSLRVPNITILNRTKGKAEELAASIQDPFDYIRGSVEVVDWEHREMALMDANILVNTTSLGMTGKDPLEIHLDDLPKKTLVTDIVYSPLETELLKTARDRGNPAVDGLGMLLHQAVPGFEAWFGVKPEVTEELRQEVLSVLLADKS